MDVGLLEGISVQTKYCQCHLVEGSGVVVPSNSLGDVQEGGDGRDQGGQVRRGQPQQVGVHHSLIKSQRQIWTRKIIKQNKIGITL